MWDGVSNPLISHSTFFNATAAKTLFKGAFTLSAVAFRADEDPVDPKKYFEDSCKPKCVKPLLAYQACVKRIQDDESGHKHCTGQYFDYWQCIDKCVAPKLFAVLK